MFTQMRTSGQLILNDLGIGEVKLGESRLEVDKLFPMNNHPQRKLFTISPDERKYSFLDMSKKELAIEAVPIKHVFVSSPPGGEKPEPGY
jgi:hypothetical protein